MLMRSNCERAFEKTEIFVPIPTHFLVVGLDLSNISIRLDNNLRLNHTVNILISVTSFFELLALGRVKHLFRHNRAIHTA